MTQRNLTTTISTVNYRERIVLVTVLFVCLNTRSIRERMFRHDEHAFMLADIDRMIVGENAGLECKTVSPYMADKWKDGKIPLSYQIQCFHYMSVCNADAWYIAALIYEKEFIVHKIQRDEQAIEDLTAIEKDFWENHVIPRKRNNRGSMSSTRSLS